MDKKYELTIITESSPAEKALESVKGLLKLNKAQDAKITDWGDKKLAYLINKNKTGHYYYIELTLPATSVNKLQSQLNIEAGILRYLLVQSEEVEQDLEKNVSDSTKN
jgi:small subunit ribosomal protein S6